MEINQKVNSFSQHKQVLNVDKIVLVTLSAVLWKFSLTLIRYVSKIFSDGIHIGANESDMKKQE